MALDWAIDNEDVTKLLDYFGRYCPTVPTDFMRLNFHQLLVGEMYENGVKPTDYSQERLKSALIEEGLTVYSGDFYNPNPYPFS